MPQTKPRGRPSEGLLPAWWLLRPRHQSGAPEPPKVIANHPELVAYGLGAVESAARGLTFVWESQDLGWLRVWIEPAGDDGSREMTVESFVDPYGLTRRELQVLTLIAGGLSNVDVAGRLGTRPRTVATQVERLLVKLDQSARSGAAAVAVEQGLLCLPVPGGAHSLMGLAIGVLDDTVRRGATVLSERRVRALRRPVQQLRPISVGLIVPAASQADTDDLINGATLAMADVNRAGGLMGRRLERVTVAADMASESSMSAAIDELHGAEVDAMTFPYISDRNILPAVLARSAASGCPVLHVSASRTAMEFVRDGPGSSGAIFQLCGEQSAYGRGFFRFLDDAVAERSWCPASRRVAILECRDDLVVTDDEGISRAEGSGWDVATLRITPGDDWPAATIVRRLAEIDPAAVLLPTFVDDDLLLDILRAIDDCGMSPLIYVVFTPSTPTFLQRAGPLAEGVVWSTLTGHYADAFGQAFEERFVGTYGRRPGRSMAGFQYDVVNLLARGWAEAGHPRRFDDVSRALRRIVHRGVNGGYWLGADSQTALIYPDETADPSIGQAHLVLQVQDGRHRIVAPIPYRERPMRPPGHARAQTMAA